ncbi:MAG: GntR family transcriptional regulator [Desulfobacula sp.]|jgi:DNA-binding GntR family transcriptional regulator|uniref:GntR family transcriptional regulator n=1 Tax=Desulfobacula sp. TaxID=2593537 RepID=UPI001EC5F791|nr:GntR family transcriptional regulator [Desulfobacula sp.]MBT4876879.1 GntR family transcriptional regulator [Desulfobacula sp.]
MPKLATIKQPESLARMAYEAIRQSILSGQWQIGELYNEKAIAADLGISRTPVREALLELASQDLIIFMPRRGLMLNRFNLRDVDEIFELRKAIEQASVEKIANTSPLPDLLAIEESLLEQRKAVNQKDYMAFIEADRKFHTSFTTLTNNSRMISIVENIRDMIQVMGIKALSLEGRAVKVIEEHQAIFKAVKEGHTKKARNFMAYHLDQSMEAVKESEL